MLRERPPLSPLQIVLALWITGLVLYLMVTRIDLPYHVHVTPQAEVVSRSLAAARKEAQLKAATTPRARVTLRFRPRGGPYTQFAADEQVVKLPPGTFLVNTYGDIPASDTLELDEDGFLYSEQGPVPRLRLLVVNGSTPSIGRVLQESGKIPVVQ
jgi:hypothetical protein